jgi:dienelactone hydrolase
MPRPVPIDVHLARLERHFTVHRPEGPGPYPVVIQLHGCGGRQPLHDSYAEAAKAKGFASLIIDSFAPRNIPRRVAQISVCTGLLLRGAERSADLFAALHWLERQSWVDQDRIAAAGWSHGAWTLMDALAGAYPACGLIEGRPERLERLRAAFLVYPYAGPPSLTAQRGWGEHRPKVAAVLGTRDGIAGQRLPRRALDRLSRDGLEVEILTLEGATHSFDDPDAADPRSRYHPDHTSRAQSFFTDTLRATLSACRPKGG